jgi:uncharacterized membrane protein YkvA (DUF1232 family)
VKISLVCETIEIFKMKNFIERWKGWARRLKIEVYALYLAYRDPRTPWYAKVAAACVAGYAFSPIDLIPDFIPVLGYLDDLVILPLGVALAIKLVPEQVMRESRERAGELVGLGKPVNRLAAVAIVCVWLAVAGLLIWWATGE